MEEVQQLRTTFVYDRAGSLVAIRNPDGSEVTGSAMEEALSEGAERYRRRKEAESDSEDSPG